MAREIKRIARRDVDGGGVGTGNDVLSDLPKNEGVAAKRTSEDRDGGNSRRRKERRFYDRARAFPASY